MDMLQIVALVLPGRLVEVRTFKHIEQVTVRKGSSEMARLGIAYCHSIDGDASSRLTGLYNYGGLTYTSFSVWAMTKQSAGSQGLTTIGI